MKQLYYQTKGRRCFYKEYINFAENPLSSKDFKLVFEAIKRVSRLLITEAFPFRIPKRLGYLRICRVGKVNPKQKINFKLSKEKGKMIPHLNLHSNGDTFRFLWDKKDKYTSFKNKKYYSFYITRDESLRYIGKRGLAQYINEVNNDPKKPNFVAPELND